MGTCSDTDVETQGENESVTENIIMDGKEVNDTKNEIENASAEDQLNMHRNASNETTRISEIANIINE